MAVKAECKWEVSRIIISNDSLHPCIINDELVGWSETEKISMSLTLEEAKALTDQLQTSINNYKRLDSIC
jgi:hypothetical protein